MLNELLPKHADNTYRGNRIALWLFGLLLFVRVAMSVNSIFNAADIASSADGIPLDTFPPAASETVVGLFALQALSRLTLSLVGILVLIRYRALVPFMFAVFLLDQLSRMLILRVMPVPSTGASPGSAITLVLLALTIVGLALSLLKQGSRPAPV